MQIITTTLSHAPYSNLLCNIYPNFGSGCIPAIWIYQKTTLKQLHCNYSWHFTETTLMKFKQKHRFSYFKEKEEIGVLSFCWMFLGFAYIVNLMEFYQPRPKGNFALSLFEITVPGLFSAYLKRNNRAGYNGNFRVCCSRQLFHHKRQPSAKLTKKYILFWFLTFAETWQHFGWAWQIVRWVWQSEANPNNNLMMRRAGLSTETVFFLHFIITVMDHHSPKQMTQISLTMKQKIFFIYNHCNGFDFYSCSSPWPQ